MFAKVFFQLEEAGPVYTLTEDQNTNSFENGLTEPTAINFYIAKKREWKKLPKNPENFDTYYNSISASYGIIQSLVHPHGSRFTQKYRISQFNNRVRGRGGRGRGRGHGGRGYGRVCGHGRGDQGGRGGRSYDKNPYKFTRRCRTFAAEACVYPADQWRLLSL